MKRIFLLSALLCSSFAYAGTSLDREAIQLSVASGNVPTQRQQIEAKLGQVEYTELSKENRMILNEQFALLESASLSSEDGLAAENRINKVLKETFADSKLVCTYVQTLGTNMKQRQCMTSAAKRRQYENTQRNLQNKDMQAVNTATGN